MTFIGYPNVRFKRRTNYIPRVASAFMFHRFEPIEQDQKAFARKGKGLRVSCRRFIFLIHEYDAHKYV